MRHSRCGNSFVILGIALLYREADFIIAKLFPQRLFRILLIPLNPINS